MPPMARSREVLSRLRIATPTLTPFIPIPKPAAAALEEEGERLLRFLAPMAQEVSVEGLS